MATIKAIDQGSVHRITSGQVVIDLQTAVKELLENSIDAGATNVEVRFKQYGLKGIEVVDNGSGIAEADYESIALKHHTSKLASFTDLTSMSTFGFRGEALSSLCALSDEVTVQTATANTTPMGVCLVMDSSGKVTKRSAIARQQGTTVNLTNLFLPLPVRRKEFERNIKREFGKALSLLTSYALGPCAAGTGTRLTVSNQLEKGPKSVQIKTLGSPSCRESVTALWGPKALENIVDMELSFEVEREKGTLKRLPSQDHSPIPVTVKGLISRFSVGSGRTGTDRQFFYVNGRPCNMSKIQKAMNEVYRSFNATQAPFIVADFVVPTESYDVNVSPDKRTILLHNEGNLISALKAAMESHFEPSRATFDLGGGTSQKAKAQIQTLLTQTPTQRRKDPPPEMHPGDGNGLEDQCQPTAKTATISVQSPPPTSITATPGPLTSEAPIPKAADPLFLHEDEAEDSMDVDEEEPLSQPPSVTLDSSQTRWGKQLGITPRNAASSSSEAEPVTETRRGEEPISYTSDEGPLRKKRKSEAASTVTDDDDEEDRVETAVAPKRSVIAVSSSNATPVGFGQRSSKVTEQVPKASSSSSKLKLMSRSKSKSNPLASLRTQLAGFARPGSQLPKTASSVAEEDEEDGEDDARMEESDDDRDEEDELAGDVEDERGTNKVSGRSSTPSSAVDVESPSRGSPPPISNVDGQATIDLTVDDEDDLEDPTSVLSQARASSSKTPSTLSTKDQIHHPEIVRSERMGGDISLRVDDDKIRRAWQGKRKSNLRGRCSVSSGVQEDAEAGDEVVPAAAGVANVEDDEKAANALARVIEKQDFSEMDVVGQFNLGFIVVRRRKGMSQRNDEGEAEAAMDDLFIVDQHAADEKYNFETLQTTTKIESQRLFRPQPLELTAADEMLALENIDLLRQNGFEIDVDENAAVGQGSRLKLAAQPISKSTVFSMKDLEELIHLLRDRPSGQMVRCSKARAMFAMRACRKSVMIGMPLNVSQMTTVIRHMGTMDQPWNCPHGRPTMRHLADVRKASSRTKDDVDWVAFA